MPSLVVVTFGYFNGHHGFMFVLFLSYSSPVAKGQKWPGGRSRVCPKCFCSLLCTWIFTLILWIIRLISRGQFFYGLKCIVGLGGQRDPSFCRPASHISLHKKIPQGIQTYYFTRITCHPNILRNCNKSLDILDFYLLSPGCRTIPEQKIPSNKFLHIKNNKIFPIFNQWFDFACNIR